MENRKTLIELKNVRKSFDGKTNVIEDVSLKIMEGEFVTLLGPSGCGKTTILRMIGGFDKPTEGEILLDGSDITLLPPNERPINTVFQKYALFPHLNVYDNVAFGLKMRKVSKEETDKLVKDALELVDLEGFEKRSIATLSGGQQQRVAIARALATDPKVAEAEWQDLAAKAVAFALNRDGFALMDPPSLAAAEGVLRTLLERIALVRKAAAR